LDLIEDYLGPKGTLILPTFTYSFTKNEIFDVLGTPSTVGMITEVFRLRKNTKRSMDPIFSVACSGWDSNWYALSDSEECFGKDSVFGRLHQKNGWLVGFGCPFDRITFTHYAEKNENVDYRYDKEFSGIKIDANGLQISSRSKYFVRDLTRKTHVSLDLLKTILQEKQMVSFAIFGRIKNWAVRSNDFYQEAKCLLANKPNGMIEEGKFA